ncbi:MAG: hypothetical protein ABI564_16170 [Ideonella sp.]
MIVCPPQTITQPLKVYAVEFTFVERKLTEPDPVRLLNVLHRAARGEGSMPPRRTKKGVLGVTAVMPSRDIAKNSVTMHLPGIAP